MLGRLLAYYWRESCNIRTVAFLVVILLLTGFIQTMVRHDESGDAQLFEPLPISVVDLDGGFFASAVIRQFESLYEIAEVHVESRESAMARLERHEILMVLLVPQQFSLNPGTGGSNRIQVFFNPQMAAEANQVARMLNQARDSFASAQAILQVYQSELQLLPIDETQRARQSDAAALDMVLRLLQRTELVPLDQSVRLKQFWFVVASLTSLFALLPALLVLMLVSQERDSGQHERLLAAHVPWWCLHLAKILIGLMWLLTGLLPLAFFVRQMLPQLSWITLFLAVVPLYLTAALFCVSLAYHNRRMEASMLAAWLVFLAAMLVGGAIYPRQLMPDWLRWAVPLSPVNWSFSLLYDGLYGDALQPRLLAFFLIPIPAGVWFSYGSWRRAR